MGLESPAALLHLFPAHLVGVPGFAQEKQLAVGVVAAIDAGAAAVFWDYLRHREREAHRTWPLAAEAYASEAGDVERALEAVGGPLQRAAPHDAPLLLTRRDQVSGEAILAGRFHGGEQLGGEGAGRADGRALGLVAGAEPEAVALEALEQTTVAILEIVDQRGLGGRAVLAAGAQRRRVARSGWKRFLI